MPQWKIGDRIENRYEIHQILGGGMGVVYICYDHELRALYALKTFQDRYFQSEQMRGRFVREAETWIALENHRNIVRALAVKNIQGKSYIILDYIANREMGGADLGRWIRRGIEVPQVLNFAVQFCDGMDYAYKKMGMVHRDIKPGNILVTQDKVVKITDFGLVKTVLAESAGEDFLETVGQEVVSGRIAFTHSGALGSPPYMSPEQWLHPQQADMRSDIYSFGVVLYEMLTGCWVFKATTLKAFKDCHLAEPPPVPTSMVPDLPRDLEAVVLRCLAKDPEQRYPNFAALREELAGIYLILTGEEIAPPVGGEALEAWEWSNKGLSLNALGYREEALTCYDRALELDPKYTGIWMNKGAALHLLGHREEALTCYDRALELDPKNSKVWSNKGAVLYTLGRCEEALTCYDRALVLDPKDDKSCVGKGLSLSALEHHEEALTCYDRALAINPRAALAWLKKGDSLVALKYHEEAITCYDHALDINPEDAEAWSKKGSFLSALGRYEEALINFNRALTLAPRLPQAWLSKGVTLTMLRRFQEALGCLTEVLEIDPDNEGAKQIIAICQKYLKQG